MSTQQSAAPSSSPFPLLDAARRANPTLPSRRGAFRAKRPAPTRIIFNVPRKAALDAAAWAQAQGAVTLGSTQPISHSKGGRPSKAQGHIPPPRMLVLPTLAQLQNWDLNAPLDGALDVRVGQLNDLAAPLSDDSKQPQA